MTEAVQTDQTDQAEALPITFTEDAAKRLQAMMDEQEGQPEALRLIVETGGCCGFQYAMAFAKGEPEDVETVIETGAIPIYLLERALPAVQGSTIRWVDNMMGSGFMVDNPNAGESCDC